MAEVIIRQTGQRIVCEDGANLLETLLGAGVFVDNPCNGKGKCGKCKVKVDGETLLSCLTEVHGQMEVETLHKERKHKVLTKGYLPEFEKDAYDGGYGIVIDIGTTTVVTGLIDLQTGEELANASMINAQKHFGLDVLTRITYEYEHPETGIRELQEALDVPFPRLWKWLHIRRDTAMCLEVC